MKHDKATELKNNRKAFQILRGGEEEWGLGGWRIKQESRDPNMSKLKVHMTFSGGFQYLEYTFRQIM